MSYIQNYPQERTVYLTLADVPATTIQYNEIVISYKKSGQISPVIKSLAPDQWISLGGGMYTIRWTATEMDTVGNFWFSLDSVKCDNLVYDEFQIIPPFGDLTGGGSELGAEDLCVLSGSVKNVTGNSPSNYKVVIQPVEFPAKYGMNVIIADAITTYTDAYGKFSLTLVRNSKVLVKVERAGIRHTVVIPDAPTANLMNLLPPFVIDYSNI